MKQGKKRFLVYLIYILLVACLCWCVEFIPHNYSMEIQRGFPKGQYSESYAEFLYYDGTDWKATPESVWITAQSGVLRIRISEALMDAEAWRLDPINEMCDTVIGQIVLKDNGFTVGVISDDFVAENIQFAANLAEYTLTEDGIILKPSNADPYLEFQETFVEECVEILRNNRVCNVLFVFLPAAFVGFLIIFSHLLFGLNEKLFSVLKHKNFRKIYPILFGMGFIVFALFLYKDYLFGDKLYVFKDVGADSYNQTFPYYMYRMKYYAEYGEFPTWSFQSGLGNSVGGGSVWDKIAAVFGYEAAPYMLAILQVVKLVLAGWFFYAYLKAMGMTNLCATIFSYCYAYCGHMTVRAAWSSYPGDVLTIAIVLWAFEQWFSKKRWYFLPLAIMWLFSASSVYFAVIHLGILCGYALYRYHVAEKRNFSGVKSILLLAGLLILGLGLSGQNPVANLVNIASNPRISGESGALQATLQGGIQWVTDIKTLAVMVVRSLAPNALDIDIAEYKGVSNYMADPAFYCGLFSLLIIPHLFYKTDGKKAVWHGIVLALPIIYMVCPAFRNLISGFTGDYQFRMNSFWVSVVLLVLAAQAFERIYRDKDLFDKKLFTGSVLLWVVLVITEMAVFGQAVDNIHLYIVVSFLILYASIMFVWRTNKQFAGGLLVVLTLVEVYLLSYDGINDRNVMLKAELNNHLGYYDGTMECMDYLQGADEEAFYRIAKDFNSVYLCDSMIQGYNGLVSYQGGTSHSGYLLRFIEEIGSATANRGMSKNSSIVSTNFLLGFRGYDEVMSMLSTKYMLSKAEWSGDFGYTKIGSFEGVNLFENEYHLPFGYLYDSYLTLSEYQQLDDVQKRKIYTATCVLPDEAEVSVQGYNEPAWEMPEASKLQEIVLLEREKADFYERLELSLECKEGDTLLFSFDVVADKDITGFICYATDGKEPNGYMNLPIAIDAGTHHYLYEISYPEIDSICFTTDRDISGAQAEVRNLRVSLVDSQEYYAAYIEEVQKLRENSMSIESFRDDEIIGSVQAEQEGILFFSIPYNTSWHAYVDGEEVEWLNVNVGFSGIWIGEGEHHIELRFGSGTGSENLREVLCFAVYGTLIVLSAVRAYHKRMMRLEEKNESRL